MKKVLLTAAAFLFALPFFVSAQAAAPAPATQPSTPPAFMKDVKTAADFDKLTPDQKKQAEDFLKKNPIGPSLASPQVDAPQGTVNCFDYYRFGSVQVDIEPTVGSTVPGIPLTFVGKLKNDNTYPVVDGSVYVKIFKKGGDDSLIHQNGYPVVDQFFAKENISLPAKGEQPISFDWKIPAFAETGDYQVAAFFMTGKRFNLLGLPFTDDVTGNTANFSIASGESTGVSFDKNQVTLNGTPFRFAAFPPHFTKDEPVTAEVSLKNTTGKTQTVNVSWTLSNWAGERTENRLDQKTEIVTLKPNETKSLSYQTTKATGSVSFLNVTATYQDTKSVLNIRYVRDGFDETRLNFPSIMGYPLTKGTENTVFSCLHSTNAPIVKDGELTLTLKDQSGNVIHTYDYQGNVTGSMMGVKDTFTPDKTYADFTLTATLKNGGRVVEEYTDTYKCQDIDPKLCPKENGPASMGGQGSAGSKGVSYLIIAVLLALLGLLVWKIRKDGGIGTGRGTGRGTKTFSLLAGMILSGALLLGAHGVEAKSVVWSGGYDGTLSYCWSNGNLAYCNTSVGSLGWGKGLTATSVSIGYNAQVRNMDDNGAILNTDNGTSSIQVGTHIKFEALPFATSDISWVGTGHSEDSPLGHWVSNAARPVGNACNAGDFVGIDADGVVSGFNVYVAYSVNPPNVSYAHSGTADLSCDVSGQNCTVLSAGSIGASVIFSSTNSKFYYAYDWVGCKSNSYALRKEISFFAGLLGVLYSNVEGSDFILTVPAQTISFNLTAVQPNQSPNLPIITPAAGNTNLTGQAQSFTFTATDPESDTLRYGIDWDNNGSVDQWVPSTGFVNSGTAQTASKAWASAGMYPFKVRSHDSKGGISAWKDGSITVNAPAVCSLGGTSVASGNSITAYSSPTVPFGSLCSGVSESRSCTNGTLSGTYANATCSVLPAPLAPVIASFTINGSSTAQTEVVGTPLAFTWSSLNAVSCYIQGHNFIAANDLGPNPAVPVNQTAAVTDTYILKCTNAVGTQVTKSLLNTVICTLLDCSSASVVTQTDLLCPTAPHYTGSNGCSGTVDCPGTKFCPTGSGNWTEVAP